MGNNNVGMTALPAPATATWTYSVENAATSSVITLTSIATAIEIAVVGPSVVGGGPATAVIKWIRSTDTQASVVSAASGANFDHVIQAGNPRRFVVPIDIVPTQFSGPGSLGPGPANGLYARVAWKTIGNASILATEY